MPSLAFETVDAFTSTVFAGNPAAVIVLSKEQVQEIDATQMQLIAREFNLSETAFVCALEDKVEVKNGEVDYLIRWFTPAAEVPLCGHATLASSHCLFTKHHPKARQINFQTLHSGMLTIQRRDNNRIELDFPADVSSHSRAIPKHSDRWSMIIRALSNALGVEAGPHVVAMCDSATGPLIEFSADGINLETAKWKPDAFTVEVSTFLVIVTQAASRAERQDVSSRVFGPLLGVPEDPVTGFAHTVLGPYWGKASAAPHARLLAAKGLTTWSKDSMECKQVSERGGTLIVRWNETKSHRVGLEGSAKTVMRGTLELALHSAMSHASPRRSLRFWTWDVFTSSPFHGNPAAVVVLPTSTSPEFD
ncbi:BQ2448_2238 [Microbotryum intermedium]|uniref:BQ2448_2238 protein n=1 Tax=Microbotryum intermedium TaxID=269621 RepID=A0A238FDK0_9BASI|nr:BQ2448_2238 [Microbotryum intermedium]